MKFLISAGEASSEFYGAQLIEALRAQLPDAEFFGLGGDKMRAAGCETAIDTRDIAVVGLAEVVTSLPRIYFSFRRLLRAVDQKRPDAAILIDSPDFNFRLARELHCRGVPVFYYVSPQLWAWRAGRIKLVRQYLRKMLVILPFEEEWYRSRGVDAVYVGHPLASLPPPAISREEFAAKHALDPSSRWIALLPGSRRKEVSMNLPIMRRAAALMEPGYQFVLPVASTLDRSWMKARVAGSPTITLTDDARATLAHSHFAVVASGTATLEAALLSTPFAMVYRVSRLTWLLGRRLVNVPWFCIVNLIAQREVAPELVQHRFRPELVEGAMRRLVDGPERTEQLQWFGRIREMLCVGGEPAAHRAAKVILESLQPNSSERTALASLPLDPQQT